MEDLLIIPGELPGINELLGQALNNRYGYGDLKGQYTNSIGQLARARIKNKYEYINLDITYYCKNKRRDPDNIMGGGQKVILDGLVVSGVINGDGWKQVKSIYSKCMVDKLNPRVEVRITGE